LSRILIVDGHNLFIRYYSILKSNDPNNLGNSIVMFINAISREIYNRNIEQVYVVFDSGSKIHKDYDSNYKSSRGKAPLLENTTEEENFFKLIYDLQSILKCIVKVVKIKFEEGDMVISYLVKKFKSNNIIYIMSNDNDFFQLLEDNVYILRGKDILLTLSNYSTILKYLEFIDPNSYAVWKSIKGDRVDNVAGVYGIGYKTLSKIFFELAKNHVVIKTPKDLKDNLYLLPPKISEKLEKSYDIIEHNYRLVSLSMEAGLISHWGKLEIESEIAKPFTMKEQEALKILEPYKNYIIGDVNSYFNLYKKLKY